MRTTVTYRWRWHIWLGLSLFGYIGCSTEFEVFALKNRYGQYMGY
ncbi:MAG: hypothetical protein AAFV07_12930 [Bacteroidota bacterium]